jgi:hypothetical protein
MGKIIQPGAFVSMRTWTDAFTSMLESSAEARNNPIMKKEVNEAVKELNGLARQTPTDNNRALAANQQAIAKQMRFSLDQHKATMARWHLTKMKLIATGWDLAQEIKFEPQPNGSFKVWQADEKICETFPAEDGQALLLFLKFVYENSDKFDPIEYTKQMLLEQGINEHNFDQYSEHLAITNPWKPVV